MPSAKIATRTTRAENLLGTCTRSPVDKWFPGHSLGHLDRLSSGAGLRSLVQAMSLAPPKVPPLRVEQHKEEVNQ